MKLIVDTPIALNEGALSPGNANGQANEYERILGDMQEIYYRTDQNGIITLLYGSLEQVLGFTPAEVIGTRITDYYVDPGKRQALFWALEAGGGKISNFEVDMTHKNGSIVWFSANSRFNRNNEGKIVGIEGAVRDITARKNAELARNESMLALTRQTERLKTLHNLDDAILRADSVSEIAQAAIDNIRQLVPCARASVGLLDVNITQLHVLATDGVSCEGAHTGQTIHLTTAMTGILKNNDENIHLTPDIQRYAADSDLVERMLKIGLKSHLTALLANQGRTIGLLNLCSTEFGAFTEEHREIIREVARSLSIGIGQVQLRDTVERHAAQLEKSVAEWTCAMDAVDDSIQILDMEGRYLLVNRTFANSVGSTSEALVGRIATEIIHPNGGEETCPVCIALKSRRNDHITLEPDAPSNRTGRAYEVTLRVILDECGVQTGTIVVRRDLTRTRKSENEVIRLNEHVRMLLESTGEGIFGVDRDLNCTFINRAAANMLGYAPNDIIGHDIHALIHHSRENGITLPRDECLIFKTVLARESVWSDNEVLWRKDGTSIPVEYSANPMRQTEPSAGAVVVFRNIAQTRALTNEMNYLAAHDTLTGLFNRHQFEQRLRTMVDSTRVDGKHHVLCYMDLDQFKVVNDTCGHVAGDELLRQLAGILHAKIRQNDMLARLGGDEFGLLLDNCPLDRALEVVKDIRETVSKFRFVWEDKSFVIGTSIGVVPITEQTSTHENAMRAADAACYLAKEHGRNRAHVYQPDDAELARRHGEIQWVTRIHRALEEKRFQLNCQRIVPMDPSRPAADRFEVLLRMVDEAGDLVLPGAFLPAAERYDLMPVIDKMVFTSTFAWLQKNLSRLDQLDLCTINLSAHSISDDSFLEFVRGELAMHPQLAKKICFEITETAAVANLTRAAAFIKDLKTLHCRFALDDFGSGMSSFAYLKNLPVDFLKIDGNFVRDIARDPVDYAMVEAINRVGHVMNLETIAEFVEDTVTLELLRRIGIDYVQGYAMGKPYPLEDF